MTLFKKKKIHTRPKHFTNHTLDKRFETRGNYMKHLRSFIETSSDRTRHNLAVHIGISEHTIRRYESESYQAPYWYEMLLRFMSGDLSFFGDQWANCRLSEGKLYLSYAYEGFKPMDLLAERNKMVNDVQRENAKLRKEIYELEREIDKLKAEIAKIPSPAPQRKRDNVILFPKAFNTIDQAR